MIKHIAGEGGVEKIDKVLTNHHALPISDDSAAFELDRMTTAGVLHSKGGKRIQNDIMRCMVHQIRNAKNFIYMENQYFLGSGLVAIAIKLYLIFQDCLRGQGQENLSTLF